MSLFRRLFFGDPPLTLEHATFGKLLLISTNGGSYWEGEPLVEGVSIGLAVETQDGQPPSEQQAVFFSQLVSDLDAAFELVASILIPEYEKWLRAKFPPSWRSAFKLAGVAVPLAGLESNPWELSFECLTDKAGKHFTCYFESGVPAHVSIDG